MNTQNQSPTLRRQLFRSHLLVMVVAVATIVVGAIAIGTVVYLADGFGARVGPGGRNDQEGPWPLFGLLMVVGAAVGAASWVASRVSARLVGPLVDVSAATDRLASGDYSTSLAAPDAALEIRQLVDEVNRLGSALDETERRRLHLIGEIAHELRTPLSTIEGSMEALMDGVVEPDDETFARVGREAARLRRLAGDLSSLSATAEPSLDRRTVQLDELLADVVAKLEPQADVKDLSMRLTAAPMSVSIDPDRVTQVLTNVIGNAIQYTDAGSVIIALEAVDGSAVVTVTDTGRGLAADQLDLVFERFHRVDEHHNDGTGVGLAVAKAWTLAHGGSVRAESEGLGLGSAFEIRLPMMVS